MRYEEVVEAIEAGKPAAAYLLHGPQTFLVESVVQALRRAVEADRHGMFASETFYADEDSGSRIAAAAREIPMLVPRRLCLVRNAEHLLKREDDWGPVAAYLDSPSPTTVLALTAEAFDGRTRLAKRFGEAGVVLKADKVDARELRGFVARQAGAAGARLSAGALDALLQACGDDLAAIHDGVSKLALYVDPDREVTVRDVEEVVPPSRQFSIFELVDAVGSRDTARAFDLITRLADQGEPPLRILAMVARQIRQLVDVKTGRDDSPRLSGLHPFVRSKLSGQAARFSQKDLVRAVTALRSADRTIKSSKREGERILEALVLEIGGDVPGGEASRPRGRR
jgi:DNA polymerase-3 subunit delta